MTKLYVGNLPFSATEDSVRTLFAAHGTVDKVSLINDRETGRPRGFGFVEMPSAAFLFAALNRCFAAPFQGSSSSVVTLFAGIVY